MRVRIPILALIFVLAVALSAWAESISGTYRVTEDGEDRSVEQFTIDWNKDGSVKAEGNTSHREGEGPKQAQITDVTELRLDAAGALRDYQRDVYVAGVPRKLFMKHDGAQFRVRINTGQGRMERKIGGLPDRLVLDRGVFHHFNLLLHKAKDDNRLGRTIPYLVPSEFREGVAYVDDRGNHAAKLGDRWYRARRYFVDLGDEGLSVWADNEGRVIRVESPMTGILAELKDYRGTVVDPPEPTNVITRAVRLEKVTFDSVDPAGNVTKLSGLLRKPAAAAPKLPALIFISETGAHDARGIEQNSQLDTLSGQLCDAIAEAGFVVLSWDDRGVGGSQGELIAATLTTHENDAKAAIKFLKARQDVDAGAVSAMGLGEGGNVALRLADEPEVVHKVIALAPSPVSFTRLAEDQIRRRLTEEEATFDEGTIARHPVMMAVEKARESKDDFAVIAGRPVYLNVYREWDGLDPAADVQRAKVPVLHLSFGKDRQVFPELTKSMTEKLAGVRLYTHSELPELDHFLVASRGTVGSYADPDRRVADEAVTTIVRWLLQK